MSQPSFGIAQLGIDGIPTLRRKGPVLAVVGGSRI
jgi:hypothetical protein